MSACGEVGSNVHALINEISKIQVEHGGEIHSNKSQLLSEGTEVARLRRQLSFVLQQACSFRTRRDLCSQEVALTCFQQLRSQRPVFAYAHHTAGVIGSKGREGANTVGGGIGFGVRGGNGDKNGGGSGNVNGNEDGAGVGRTTEMVANDGT